ncbi:protein FAM47E-like isoform X1 [Podarcis raffonei]|uniref:protein FAM47E-like isoform X1 n=1 Tax=Podarcis raffonei TaxID=65483 RepID=UPI002329600A|nr:protein FAM47E-like isoform X1 [Podarcis raffonei]
MNYPPGYKERLATKCFQERVANKEKFSDALNGQRWRFLKSGLDDFRNGYPPPSDNIIIRGKKGPVPVILEYKKPGPSQLVPYTDTGMKTRSDIVFSKLSASQRAKKEYIAQTERCLAQHPLALYPHLEDSLPPEMFQDVVKLLDPEMHLARGSPDYSKTEVVPPTVQYRLQQYDKKSESGFSQVTPPWAPKSKNPYTWFSKKEVTEREKAAQIAYIPPLDENVKRATKEFVEWVSSMGVEKYNIDEATIMKLFDTSYESESKTSSPMKIVQLYNVPGELKECLGRRPDWQTIKNSMKTPPPPKWDKIKYGAWYLPPKKWKKKKVRDEEEIPVCLQSFMDLRKKKAAPKVEEASGFHAIYAFEQFLDRKGYRKPQGKAVCKPKRFGDLTGKTKTKKTGAKDLNRSSSENLKELHEAKLEEFKKSVCFPPIYLKRKPFLRSPRPGLYL